MSKKITIYTTNTCAFCEAVKKLLESKEQKYSVINIDEQPEKRDELLTFTDKLAVPVVVIAEEGGAGVKSKVVQGWNPAALLEAVA